jgi:hypothetical protein
MLEVTQAHPWEERVKASFNEIVILIIVWVVWRAYDVHQVSGEEEGEYGGEGGGECCAVVRNAQQ